VPSSVKNKRAVVAAALLGTAGIATLAMLGGASDIYKNVKLRGIKKENEKMSEGISSISNNTRITNEILERMYPEAKSSKYPRAVARKKFSAVPIY